MIELTCDYTGETFLKDKREYERQLREGATKFYKDRKTAGIANGTRRRIPPITRQCLNCSTPFEVRPVTKSTHYCSRRCQGTHSGQLLKADPEKYEAFRKNASDGSKQAWSQGKFDNVVFKNGQKRPHVEHRECPICQKSFECKSNSRQRTCKQPECVRQLMSRMARANPNCGGETNYKRYTYKDITMDSAWEVEVAQWMDTHQVKWVRSRKMMFYWTDETGAKRRYYPDFYLPEYNVYLDPKNKYLIEKDRFKILAVQRENNITIIWGLRETLFAYLEAAIKTA